LRPLVAIDPDLDLNPMALFALNAVYIAVDYAQNEGHGTEYTSHDDEHEIDRVLIHGVTFWISLSSRLNPRSILDS